MPQPSVSRWALVDRPLGSWATEWRLHPQSPLNSCSATQIQKPITQLVSGCTPVIPQLARLRRGTQAPGQPQQPSASLSQNRGAGDAARRWSALLQCPVLERVVPIFSGCVPGKQLVTKSWLQGLAGTSQMVVAAAT